MTRWKNFQFNDLYQVENLLIQSIFDIIHVQTPIEKNF